MSDVPNRTNVDRRLPLDDGLMEGMQILDGQAAECLSECVHIGGCDGGSVQGIVGSSGRQNFFIDTESVIVYYTVCW